MRVFSGNDYSLIYYKALLCCYEEGEKRGSRAGKTLDLGPVCFEVNGEGVGLPFIRGRGINVFFALAEIAWVLEGNNKLAPLEYFIDNYGQYSDDSETLYGAYGYRIFEKFGLNQLDKVISELKKKPDSRRAVISLFSALDLKNLDSLDIPCNISVLFKVRNECVDITVFNRSNDVFKGIPYNFFIFRFLQYYVAKKLSRKIGWHRHITDSLHLYESNNKTVQSILECSHEPFSNNEPLEFNIFDELISNSQFISSMDWDRIESPSLRWLFQSYRSYKDKEDVASFCQREVGGKLSLFVDDWLRVHHS
ncbi:thymidylate synthase [Amphritea sp.]|uniref:thymidylate synthase n=1 Tax=Amphritea sp. TaxID=1872502 RepID=UPI003A949EA5